MSVKRKSHLPLRFKSIDCHVIENATRHITKQYEQTRDLRSARRSTALKRPSAQQEGPDSPLNSAHLVSDTQVTASEDSAHRDSLAHLSVDSHDSHPEIPAFRVSVPRSAAFHPSEPQLVLRRGQKFTIELAFDRPYDRDVDDIVFTFQFGTTSQIGHITSVVEIVKVLSGVRHS